MTEPEKTTDEVDAEARRAARSEARAVALILAAVMVLLAVDWLAARWGDPKVRLERLPEREFDFIVDVNSCREAELVHLPGIGPKVAEKIIANRIASGPFRNVDELRRVSGVGPKTLESIRPYIKAEPLNPKRK